MPERSSTTAARIAQLIAQRQALRARGAGAAALERNRLELVELQQRFNRELLARFCPQASAA